MNNMELPSENPEPADSTVIIVPDLPPSSESVRDPDKPGTINLSKKKQRKLRRHQKSLEYRKEKRAKERQTLKEKGLRKSRSNGVKLAEIEKLKNGLQVGCRVAIDCQYQNLMSEKEQKRFAQQIRRVYSSNRSSESPLHLYLTSLVNNSKLFSVCCKQNDGFAKYVLDIKEKSVLELFEPSEVVYLTPDAPTVISLEKGFEKDKVYVIGGLVDETVQKNVSVNFAQTAKLACAKLPIEEFFENGDKGTFKKILTINQVVDIILEWHKSHDWVTAISKALPERTGLRPKSSLAVT